MGDWSGQLGARSTNSSTAAVTRNVRIGVITLPLIVGSNNIQLLETRNFPSKLQDILVLVTSLTPNIHIKYSLIQRGEKMKFLKIIFFKK